MKDSSKVRKIAFVGDYLPRKCGIATFTSDLLTAVADAHLQSPCFAVSVNDIKGGYEYPNLSLHEIFSHTSGGTNIPGRVLKWQVLA